MRLEMTGFRVTHTLCTRPLLRSVSYVYSWVNTRQKKKKEKGKGEKKKEEEGKEGGGERKKRKSPLVYERSLSPSSFLS